MWTVTYHPDAAKALKRMDSTIVARIRAKLHELAKDPLAPNNNLKRLVGSPSHRYRMGDWRVILTMDRKTETLHVLAVGPRGSIYDG
jgi:mRNA-degrading endonuclease RelE of RelBE toxin-antitoxin system